MEGANVTEKPEPTPSDLMDAAAQITGKQDEILVALADLTRVVQDGFAGLGRTAAAIFASLPAASPASEQTPADPPQQQDEHGGNTADARAAEQTPRSTRGRRTSTARRGDVG